MEISPKARRAKPEDSLRIWEIRNTPQSRQESINRDEIPWENHKSWFQRRYLENEDNTCFVLDYNSKVIGYCRFDSEQGLFMISIALDPKYHGRGLGSLFLTEAISKFGHNKTILAKVRKNNYSSVRMFEKVGFYIVSEDDTYIYFKKDPNS